ncbi:kinesin motor domain-containing protein [Toxoplasma gondii ME49]|uniref:Kinesin motor domain-containing protein n=2 Tax=Toxoplasma gondii TaxID=5811 RepID=A0A086KMH8_TOXGO|nr:kinesin motor domain-containing protein [Toxoplasma gondii ME49]EPT26987.1 kinesin motor domain-containing protein [Toxoplasma gondii ME49]KFG45596.1 kinesin motor domain-containing protein [Toxoplasma gondii GAB2-2007-GAL-DOM2]|eukprot:XP_002366162.1 kinesin motor domain-containing protein [Toxoplasma gondii ME49]
MEYPQGRLYPSRSTVRLGEAAERGSGSYLFTLGRSYADDSVTHADKLRGLTHQSETDDESVFDFASDDDCPILRIEDLESPKNCYRPFGSRSSVTSPCKRTIAQDTSTLLPEPFLKDRESPCFAMTAAEWIAEEAASASSSLARPRSSLPPASSAKCVFTDASRLPATTTLLPKISSAQMSGLVPSSGAEIPHSSSPLHAEVKSGGVERSVSTQSLATASPTYPVQSALASSHSASFSASSPPSSSSQHPALFPPTSTEPYSDRLRTFVRIRPLQNEELHSEDILVVESATRIKVSDKVHESQGWTFDVDRVFGPQATQEDIWNSVATCVEKVIDGYNCTIFAHGQTGTGKTYTMLGPDMIEGCKGCELLSGEQSRDYVVYKQAKALRVQTINRLIQHHTKQSSSLLKSEGRGIIPRACELLFDQIHKRFGMDNENVKVFASYVQIYNEKLVDLLAPPNSQTSSLSIVSDSHNPNSVVVQGLQLFEVKSTDELIHLLMEGTFNRAFRATKQNDMSGRSHAIFQVELRQTVNGETKTMKVSRLNLVDLAGNERCVRSRATEKMHVAEIGAINRSLSTLTLCIQQLAQGKSAVSYRSSNLTRLLQESLGGSCWTVFICTITPSALFVRETLATLRLSVRAKTVKITAKLNEPTKPPARQKSIQREVSFSTVLARRQRHPSQQRYRGRSYDAGEQARRWKPRLKTLGPPTGRTSSCGCETRGEEMLKPAEDQGFDRRGSHAECRKSSNFCIVSVNQVSASAVQHPFRPAVLGSTEMHGGQHMPHLHLSTQKVEFSALAVLESAPLPQQSNHFPNYSDVESSVFSHGSDDSVKARNLRTAVRFLRRGLQRSISCPDQGDGTSLSDPTPRDVPFASVSHHPHHVVGLRHPVYSDAHSEINAGTERIPKEDGTVEKEYRSKAEGRLSSSNFQGAWGDSRRTLGKPAALSGSSSRQLSDITEKAPSPGVDQLVNLCDCQRDPETQTSEAIGRGCPRGVFLTDHRTGASLPDAEDRAILKRSKNHPVSHAVDVIKRIHQRVQDRREVQAQLKGEGEKMNSHLCSALSVARVAPQMCSSVNSASKGEANNFTHERTGTREEGGHESECDSEHQQVQMALQVLRYWLERKHNAHKSQNVEHFRECGRDDQHPKATSKGQRKEQGFTGDSDRKLQSIDANTTEDPRATSGRRNAKISGIHLNAPSTLCGETDLRGGYTGIDETAEYQTEAGDESSEACSGGDINEDIESSESDCEQPTSLPCSGVAHGGQKTNDVPARSVTSSLLPNRYSALYYGKTGSLECRVPGGDSCERHNEYHVTLEKPDWHKYERKSDAQEFVGYNGRPRYDQDQRRSLLFQSPSMVSHLFSQPVAASTCSEHLIMESFDPSPTSASFRIRSATRASVLNDCAVPPVDCQMFSSPEQHRWQHVDHEVASSQACALRSTRQRPVEPQIQYNTSVDQQSTGQWRPGISGIMEGQTNNKAFPPTSQQSHNFKAFAPSVLGTAAGQASHNPSAVSPATAGYVIPPRDRQTRMASSSSTPGLEKYWYAQRGQSQHRQFPGPDCHVNYGNGVAVSSDTGGILIHSASQRSLLSCPPQHHQGPSRAVGTNAPAFQDLPGDCKTPLHVSQSRVFYPTHSSAGSLIDGSPSSRRLSLPPSPAVEGQPSFRQTGGSSAIGNAGESAYFHGSVDPSRSTATAQTRQHIHVHSSVPSQGTRGGCGDQSFIPFFPPQHGRVNNQTQHLPFSSEQEPSVQSYARGQYIPMDHAMGAETPSQQGSPVPLPTRQFQQQGVAQGCVASSDKRSTCSYHLLSLPPQPPHNQAMFFQQQRVPPALPPSFDAAGYQCSQPNVQMELQSSTPLPQGPSDLSGVSTSNHLQPMARSQVPHFCPGPAGPEVCRKQSSTPCYGNQSHVDGELQRSQPPEGSRPGVHARAGGGFASNVTFVSNPPLCRNKANSSAVFLPSTASTVPASPLQSSRMYDAFVPTEGRRRVADSSCLSHRVPLRDACYLSHSIREGSRIAHQ